MKVCSICKNKVHIDDLVSAISPMNGSYGMVCPTCIADLENAFVDQVKKIEEYSKLSRKMKTIELSELVAGTILSFCENLAELGYRPVIEKGKVFSNDQNGPDMWFRYLSHKEQNNVAQKLIDIAERDGKNTEENKKAKNKGKNKS